MSDQRCDRAYKPMVTTIPLPDKPGQLLIPAVGPLARVTPLFHVVRKPHTIIDTHPGWRRIPAHERWRIDGLFVLPSKLLDMEDDLGTASLRVNTNHWFTQPVSLLMQAWRGLVTPLGPAGSAEDCAARVELFRKALGLDNAPVEIDDKDDVWIEFSDERCTNNPPQVVLLGRRRCPL